MQAVADIVDSYAGGREYSIEEDCVRFRGDDSALRQVVERVARSLLQHGYAVDLAYPEGDSLVLPVTEVNHGE